MLAVVVGIVVLGSVVGGFAVLLQERTGPPAAATPVVPVATAAEYDEALAPLRARSDVLERRFARVQGRGYTGPDAVRTVLEEIVPEYADLLERARAVQVEDPALDRAHDVLLASLTAQQEGLETALAGFVEDDALLVARAGKQLLRAERLLREHRRLLAAARR